MKVINESKTLIRPISCQCKYKFDSRKFNSTQKWNNDKSQCECKKRKKYRLWEEDYALTPSRCTCQYDNHGDIDE